MVLYPGQGYRLLEPVLLVLIRCTLNKEEVRPDVNLVIMLNAAEVYYLYFGKVWTIFIFYVETPSIALVFFSENGVFT